MVDLSDARKKASKMSRKDLHRINRNNVSRRLHNSKIRLDRERLEKIQYALENKKLSLSVTALDDVINSLFFDLINPSTYDSLHTSNLDKLKQVHESVTRSDATKDTRIRTLVAGHNDMSEELRQKNAGLDTARAEVSDSTNDCERLEARLKEANDANLHVEESLRKRKSDLRDFDHYHTYNVRRVAYLEKELDKTRLCTQGADDRANTVDDELRTANHLLRDSERERAKLETEYDQLQTVLKTAKEQLNGEAGLKKKTRDLNAAHEQIHQLQLDVSLLKTQHADAITEKDREVSSLKEQHADIVSSNDKNQKEEVESLRTQLTATITARKTELEASRAEHLTAIKLKDAELKAAIVARDSIRSEYLSIHLASVNLQKDEDAKGLERLRIEHAAALTCKEKELNTIVSRHDDAMRELRGQFDLVTQQKEDEANRLKDLRIEHTAAMNLKDKERDDIVSRHERQMQELREELHLAKEQKANEAKKLEHSRTEHATAINLKDAELQEAHYELAIAISGKESEIGTLHTKHAAAISGKESEIGSIHTEHTAVIARKEEELAALRTRHAAAIVPKDDNTVSSLAPQQASSASEGEEKRRADSLKALVELQDAKNMAIKREWVGLEGTVQNVLMDLLTALRKFGKPNNTCHDAIWARRRQDPERKCKPILYQTISTDRKIVTLPLTCLETEMDIRRVKIELEETVDHQCAFIKKFAAAIVKAHPEVEEMAKAIDDTLAQPAQQVVQPTQAPTTTPAPAVATQEVPPKATCACEYHFLVADSQDACRDHLDGCDDFAKWTPEEKTSLLGKLGLNAYRQSKQTKAKAESITCRHCGREFGKVYGQWFHGSHIKVTLSYTASIQCLASIHAF